MVFNLGQLYDVFLSFTKVPDSLWSGKSASSTGLLLVSSGAVVELLAKGGSCPCGRCVLDGNLFLAWGRARLVRGTYLGGEPLTGAAAAVQPEGLLPLRTLMKN